MKTTEEKIKIMQAFVNGYPILMVNSGIEHIIQKDQNIDIIWNWADNDYQFPPTRVNYKCIAYVNTYDDGLVRHERCYNTARSALLNSHSADDRVGVEVTVYFEEVIHD